MWTYLEVRRGKGRKDLWMWTAVVEERDGVRWRMYEAGGSDLSAFSRLLGRLPGAAGMRSTLILCTSGCLGTGM